MQNAQHEDFVNRTHQECVQKRRKEGIVRKNPSNHPMYICIYIDDNVCSGVANRWCTHESAILIFFSPVASQLGK